MQALLLFSDAYTHRHTLGSGVSWKEKEERSFFLALKRREGGVSGTDLSLFRSFVSKKSMSFLFFTGYPLSTGRSQMCVGRESYFPLFECGRACTCLRESWVRKRMHRVVRLCLSLTVWFLFLFVSFLTRMCRRASTRSSLSCWQAKLRFRTCRRTSRNWSKSSLGMARTRSCPRTNFREGGKGGCQSVK